MQILHFDWLRYYLLVPKFTGFVNLFISFYSHTFFLAELIIAFFCPTSWMILKQLDPFALKGHGS